MLLWKSTSLVTNTLGGMGVETMNVSSKDWIGSRDNLEFMNIFPVTNVEHLIRDGSDHTPIQVVAKTEAMTMVKPFRF